MLNKQVLSIILGGGKGTRLYPLTKFRAKPAVPLGGKFRLIDIPISNCINSELKQIYILTQFNTHSLHRHIHDTYRMGRFAGGFVDILSAEQTVENANWYQGTADAVRQNISYINEVKAKYNLILSGDHLYRMNYADFIDFHIEKNADISISVKPVSAEEAGEFGIIQTDESNRLIRFVEKPGPEQLESLVSPGLPAETPYLASMGIYVFNNENLNELLDDPLNLDFGKHIIPRALVNKQIYAYHFTGYWKDIGTIKSFYNANLAIASMNPPFSFYDEKAPVYTRSRSLPGSRIELSQIGGALIGDGCFILNANITNSVIGLRTKICPGVTIENSVLMGADYYDSSLEHSDIPLGIGENTIIRNAIVDKNARIGRNVQIINRDNLQEFTTDMYSIQDGIIVIPKKAVIPDGTII